MNLAETTKILAIIDEIYPGFIKGRDVKSTATIWQMIFPDESFTEVQKAVMAFVAHDVKGFAPVPGMIKAELLSMRPNASMSENEAWGYVSKALKNSMYGYREEFAKLPAEIQQAIGHAEMLREWAMMDESEVQTVIASNFQRSFRAKQASMDKLIALPSSFRENLPGFDRIGLMEG